MLVYKSKRYRIYIHFNVPSVAIIISSRTRCLKKMYCSVFYSSKCIVRGLKNTKRHGPSESNWPDSITIMITDAHLISTTHIMYKTSTVFVNEYLKITDSFLDCYTFSTWKLNLSISATSYFVDYMFMRFSCPCQNGLSWSDLH